jgi:hypothetical protein
MIPGAKSAPTTHHPARRALGQAAKHGRLRNPTARRAIPRIAASRFDARAAQAFRVTGRAALWPRVGSMMEAIDQHKIRVLLYPIEHDFLTVAGDVEILDDDIAGKTGELTLQAGFEINLP